MKVLKETSRRYKGKEYFKYKVNLPIKFLQDSDLKEGDELIVEAKRHQLILKKT